MDRTVTMVEFYGEYDSHSQQLTGVWVSFPESWRMPSLWRDTSSLIEAVKEHLRDDAEFTPDEIALLRPGQTIVCDGLGRYDALNVLGSPLQWEL